MSESNDHRYPIAEIFTSLQGEGAYTGAPMTFVRFAGCNVGRVPPRTHNHAAFPILNGHTICENVFGDQFQCDTDYAVKEKLSAASIVDQIKANRVCFTGGEPALQNFQPLFDALPRGLSLHIETSGSVLLDSFVVEATKREFGTYVACSPKKGFLDRNAAYVDEYRFVVPDLEKDAVKEAARVADFLDSIGEVKDVMVYIGAVNHVQRLGDQAGVIAAVHSLMELGYRNARLNLQTHKILGVR